MAVTCDYAFKLTGTETLTNVDGVTTATLVHDAFNETGSLSASTTPAVTMVYDELVALTAGAYTIDLTSLTGSNGAVQDGTGLRVQMIRVKNLGANAMTFSEGASNGIALACGTFVVPASGITQMYLADASPDIAAGDRTIDVAGTGTQTFEISIYLG